MTTIQHKKILLIRADASHRIGTGHIMRCIALAQAWQDMHAPAIPDEGHSRGGARRQLRGSNTKDCLPADIDPLSLVTFLCADIPDALAEQIKREGFGLRRITAKPGSPEDQQQTLNAIHNVFSDGVPISPALWLVLDGYLFNLNYQRGIRAAGIKVLLIDDYNHLPEYDADILVNQNLGAEDIAYHANPECRKLLGLKYVMLRRQFHRSHTRARRGLPKRILITMGGSDPDNATQKVLHALQRLNISDLQVKVIIGLANQHADALQQFARLSPLNCQLLLHVQDMPQLMKWADFVITAAGSTCWELMALQVPFATVILAENQTSISRQLEMREGIASIGRVEHGFEERFARIMSRKSQQAVSNLGSERIEINGCNLILNVMC